MQHGNNLCWTLPVRAIFRFYNKTSLGINSWFCWHCLCDYDYVPHSCRNSKLRSKSDIHKLGVKVWVALACGYLVLARTADTKCYSNTFRNYKSWHYPDPPLPISYFPFVLNDCLFFTNMVSVLSCSNASPGLINCLICFGGTSGVRYMGESPTIESNKNDIQQLI